MKVRDVIQTVLKEFAAEKTPSNFLRDYSGTHRREVKSAMELLTRFKTRYDALSLRIVSRKPTIYRALGQNVFEKSVLKVLEKDGVIGSSVDLLVEGKGEQTVTGIVTAFMLNADVLEQTIAQGANFVITHEPTYYNHLDQTDWLKNDEVFQYKKALIDQHEIAVWRFHDLIHLFQPDMIVEGFLQKLGLREQAEFNDASNVLIHLDTTKQDFINLLKETFSLSSLRIVGSAQGEVHRIAYLCGSIGGMPQISLISQYQPELVLCGEINEWETSEYVRDAQKAGKSVTLLILGHQVSEEAGMEYLAEWLRPKITTVPVTFIASSPAIDIV